MEDLVEGKESSGVECSFRGFLEDVEGPFETGELATVKSEDDEAVEVRVLESVSEDTGGGGLSELEVGSVALEGLEEGFLLIVGGGSWVEEEPEILEENFFGGEVVEGVSVGPELAAGHVLDGVSLVVVEEPGYLLLYHAVQLNLVRKPTL